MSNPVYSTSYDHDVKAVVLYAGSDETLGENFMRLYTDEDRTVEVSAEELEKLFLTGMLLIEESSGRYLRPTHFTRGDTSTSFSAVLCYNDQYASAGEEGYQ